MTPAGSQIWVSAELGLKSLPPRAQQFCFLRTQFLPLRSPNASLTWSVPGVLS